MRVIFYKAHCFHLHRLFHRRSILHISVSTSHETSNTTSSEITPCDFKDLAHFTVSGCPLVIFLAETREEMETLSLIIGMFVRKYSVEEVNIE